MVDETKAKNVLQLFTGLGGEGQTLSFGYHLYQDWHNVVSALLKSLIMCIFFLSSNKLCFFMHYFVCNK